MSAVELWLGWLLGLLYSFFFSGLWASGPSAQLNSIPELLQLLHFIIFASLFCCPGEESRPNTLLFID